MLCVHCGSLHLLFASWPLPCLLSVTRFGSLQYDEEREKCVPVSVCVTCKQGLSPGNHLPIVWDAGTHLNTNLPLPGWVVTARYSGSWRKKGFLCAIQTCTHQWKHAMPPLQIYRATDERGTSRPLNRQTKHSLVIRASRPAQLPESDRFMIILHWDRS